MQASGRAHRPATFAERWKDVHVHVTDRLYDVYFKELNKKPNKVRGPA